MADVTDRLPPTPAQKCPFWLFYGRVARQALILNLILYLYFDFDFDFGLFLS